MEDAFLEVVFVLDDLGKFSPRDAQHLEDLLNDALVSKSLGEVSGGGTGSGYAIVDIEITDAKTCPEAIALIRQTLIGVGVPKSTIIKRYKPERVVYNVYESSIRSA